MCGWCFRFWAHQTPFMTFVVIRKCEEDELLAFCDDTCASPQCACVADLGMGVKGTAMRRYGIKLCLLCSRKRGQPEHDTVPDGYPLAWTKTKNKVRYEPSDYLVDGRAVTQAIPEDAECSELSALSELYTLYVEPAEEFRMAVCNKPRCKDRVHSRIGVYKALGFDRCYMDMRTRELKCEHCDDALCMLESVDNKITFMGKTYSTCFMCDTVIICDGPVTLCATCSRRVNLDIFRSTQTCVRCDRFVSAPPTALHARSNTQRGTQVFSFEKEPDAYLCRDHRVFPQPTKVKSKDMLRMITDLYFSRHRKEPAPGDDQQVEKQDAEAGKDHGVADLVVRDGDLGVEDGGVVAAPPGGTAAGQLLPLVCEAVESRTALEVLVVAGVPGGSPGHEALLADGSGGVVQDVLGAGHAVDADSVLLSAIEDTANLALE